MIMAKIFISYRREDTGYPAQNIYDRLVDHFGKESVVFDVDTIPFGLDFREYLNQEVGKCEIMLAVIGDRWLDILKQRLNEPNDFVRIEIQAALERKIPVVPVLVEKALVPSEKDLPRELVELVYKQAAEARVGSNYQAHINRLIKGLDYLLADILSDEEPKAEPRKPTPIEIPELFTNGIGMEFALIPAGSFTMGSSLGIGEKNERPSRTVKITRPFYLQKTQVTQRQWKKVVGNNPSNFEGCGDCPVEMVSWDDTQGFIKKLNEIERGEAYRLPTDSEWEYATRAGTTTLFWFGDDVDKLTDYNWFRSNSESKTHPAGQKKPNPWGLYDLHGNVGEWVEDDWHDDYNGAPDDGRSWVNEPRGDYRVIRGGGWYGGARGCRSATRSSWGPGFRFSVVGFRLSRSVSLGP
jgi:formylglycine-generating enzyme required for sulfatase activity